MMRDAFGLAIAALVVAGLLHYGLSRLSRRLPRWLARRRGLPVGRDLPHRGAIALGTLALELLLWLTAFAYASERVSEVARARDEALAMVTMGARMTLFTVGEREFSAIELFELPAVLLAVWIGVGLVVRGVRVWLADVAGAQQGLTETVSVLARYALAACGFLLVFQSWGVDVRSFAIVASVLGVGIGFGLQNLANNFVSGLVLNVGRPIQPGDFVVVGQFSGTVRRIGPRSTEILTSDEVAIVVPNSRFLEQEVVNWSHGDPYCRVHVPVGIAYGTDLGAARRALLAAAAGHPAVLREPRPSVALRAFGASGLEFELLVWTSDPRRQDELKSDLNLLIHAALRERGVELAFADQRLHVCTSCAAHAVEPAPKVSVGAALDRERARPEFWDVADLDAVAERLRAPDGVEIRDRRHRLTVFPRCFIGREAVDWLVEREGLSRAEGTALGQRLVEKGVIRHVRDEHDFRDGHYFYRFRSAAVTSGALAHLYTASNRQGESREHL